MRDKHIKIAKDSELLKHIYSEVDKQLNRKKVNFRTRLIIKFMFYFALSCGSYYLLFTVHEPLFFISAFVLFGLSSVLLAFNFSHDFSHNTIFKSKKLNNICYTVIYALVGAHAEAWKMRHVHSHHYAPNVQAYDSDLQITTLIRVTPTSEYKWYHSYQHIYAPLAYSTYSLFWVFIKDFVLLFSEDEFSDKKDFKYHCSFWVQKLFYITYIILLPLLFSGQAWQVILLGFLVMHFTQSLFLLFTFFMTHHVEKTAYPTLDENGYIKTSWLMNQVKSSNDMHPFSETANFILGGFNNHVAHHLFPHYHHIYYPALNKILYDILIKNGITPNQTSYLGGAVSHLKLLKLRGVKL